MSRSRTNSRFVLRIKVPRSGRSGYIATCAIKPVQAVTDAEIDLLDAIIDKHLGERQPAMRAYNDNSALEAKPRDQLAERPQV